jgi:transposase-like protein
MIRSYADSSLAPTCPICGMSMTLVRIDPRVASFTELHTFRCFACDDLPARELEKTQQIRAVSRSRAGSFR